MREVGVARGGVKGDVVEVFDAARGRAEGNLFEQMVAASGLKREEGNDGEQQAQGCGETDGMRTLHVTSIERQEKCIFVGKDGTLLAGCQPIN